MTWDRVRRLGLTLPDVEDGTAWGVPALRAGGKVLACIARHRSADPASIVVMLPFETRDDLVAEQPDVYYLTDHYRPHGCVVVRLSAIRPEAMRDLLLMAQRFLASRGRRQSPRRRKQT